MFVPASRSSLRRRLARVRSVWEWRATDRETQGFSGDRAHARHRAPAPRVQRLAHDGVHGAPLGLRVEWECALCGKRYRQGESRKSITFPGPDGDLWFHSLGCLDDWYVYEAARRIGEQAKAVTARSVLNRYGGCETLIQQSLERLADLGKLERSPTGTVGVQYNIAAYQELRYRAQPR